MFEGKTTGHPISLIINNKDQRSKDYSEIKDKFVVLTPNAINYKSNKKLLEIYEFEAPVMLFNTKILKIY